MNPNSDQTRDNQPQPQPSGPPAQYPSVETDLPEQPQPTTVEPVVAPIAPSQIQPASSKRLAISALTVGIIAFLTGFLGVGILLGIVAIVMGAIALIEHKPGKVMAICGIVLGALAIFVGGLLFLLFISAASFNSVQDRAGQTQQRTDEAIQEKQT